MDEIGVCDLSGLQTSLPFSHLTSIYIMYVEDLLAIGDTELSSFFYDSEVNRLFYMIPMLVFVFSGFLFCYIYLLHGDLRTCLWKL